MTRTGKTWRGGGVKRMNHPVATVISKKESSQVMTPKKTTSSVTQSKWSNGALIPSQDWDKETRNQE